MAHVMHDQPRESTASITAQDEREVYLLDSQVDVAFYERVGNGVAGSREPTFHNQLEATPIRQAPSDEENQNSVYVMVRETKRYSK